MAILAHRNSLIYMWKDRPSHNSSRSKECKQNGYSITLNVILKKWNPHDGIMTITNKSNTSWASMIT